MEFMPTTANGKAQARRFHTSVRRENAPRNRKHQPPPKRNQLGVQIFLTTGQVPATPQSQPEAQPTMPAMANQRTLASGLFLFDASEDAVESADDEEAADEACGPRKTPPAIRPRIMVPRVGMKLRVE